MLGDEPDSRMSAWSPLMKRPVILMLAIPLLATALQAKGMLPATKPEAAAAAPAVLRIGDQVTDAFIVYDLQGSSRTLTSYKTPVDIMAVLFLAAGCPSVKDNAFKLHRAYETYKEWGVTFVAVEGNSQENPQDLLEWVKKAKLPAGTSAFGVPVVRDPQSFLARHLGVDRMPAVVIIDESGVLRFRGPPGPKTTEALTTVISHLQPVAEAEPPLPEGCPIQ